MKITKVESIQPDTPGSPPDWRTQLGQILVRIETDEGLVGIGVGGGGQAGIHLIETVLSEMLVGRDSSDVETLHQEMFDRTCFYGRSGLVIMAISGVDLALWDLRGKRAGQYVADLLGEWDRQQALPTYSTVWGEDAAAEAIQNGAKAIKLHVERFGDRPNASEIAELVEATRERLGPEAPIMMDAFGRWDVDSTRRVDEAISPFGVAWIEEPLPPDEFEGYGQLVRCCNTPIAGGEHEYGRAGFKRLVDDQLHSILQPDINWCGGLTTLLQIYEMTSATDISVCPHRGCEPYALPALLAIDPEPLAESPRTWFNCLSNSPKIEHGVISVPTGVGFGVDMKPGVWNR